MKKQLIIRIDNKGEAVAVLENNQLAEVYLPAKDDARLIGNIYLGRVDNVLPGMQAAFVDIGLEKNSFLYVEDAMSQQTPAYAANEEAPRKRNINELVKKDQQLIAQIFKEPSGSKGARITMYPSLPGRYLVLLPCGDYIAVSRRIEDEEDRERLKDLIRGELPDNMGVIIRTVARDADKQALIADLKQLIKMWRRIQGRSAKAVAPEILHQDLDLLSRVIRDANQDEVEKIIVSNQDVFEHVEELIEDIAPELKSALHIKECADTFLEFDIYNQLERALRRKVWLESGGYIIIDQVEALTVVDVNTGKYVGESNLNDTVYKTNLEAVQEIVRQLRLRNIGGIVIIDFIDMDDEECRVNLLKALEEETKKDRVRITIMGMTHLGLVELTRKKIGHDLSYQIEKECPSCGGKGRISQLQRKKPV